MHCKPHLGRYGQSQSLAQIIIAHFNVSFYERHYIYNIFGHSKREAYELENIVYIIVYYTYRELRLRLQFIS